MKKLLLFFIFSCLISTSAFADGGYFRVGGMYLNQTEGSDGATTKETRTLIDIGGGYLYPSGWTIGLLYEMEKFATNTTANRTAYGPTFGWVTKKDMGPYALATYLFSVKRDDLYTGAGYQLDLGYKILLKKLSFAPQLTYRSIAYDKVDGQTLSPKYIDKKIEPLLMVWIDF